MEEDVSANPVLTSLRVNFEKLFQVIVAGGHVLMLPSAAAASQGIQVTQVFIESHVLQKTHVPGSFLNLMGQGVELRDGSVSTSFGFKEQRVCNIVREDNMFEFGTAYKIITIDKPLYGHFEPQAVASQGDIAKLLNAPPSGALFSAEAASLEKMLTEWTEVNPGLREYFDSLLDCFQRCYVLWPGLEHAAALRLQAVSKEMVRCISEERPGLQSGAQQAAVVRRVVDRFVYSRVHDVLWPHLCKQCKTKNTRVRKACKAFGKDIPKLLTDLDVNAALFNLDLTAACDELGKLDSLKTPHGILECLEEVCRLLYKEIEEHSKRSTSPVHSGARRGAGPIEVTGDDVLGLLVACAVHTRLAAPVSAAALADMYLSQKSPTDRFEQSSYVFTTFHSALAFLLQQHE